MVPFYMVRAACDWSAQDVSDYIEVQGSHAVYVSQPQAVASIIETAAKGVALATK